MAGKTGLNGSDPREILETLKLQEGDFVAFQQASHRRAHRTEARGDPDQVLTPAEAKKVRRALKQVRQGKAKPLARSNTSWVCEVTEDAEQDLASSPKPSGSHGSRTHANRI